MYYVLEAYRSTDDNVCLPMVPQRDIDGLAESFAMAGYMVITYEKPVPKRSTFQRYRPRGLV